MSHNSQDSIRAELEVLPCSCLRRPKPLCRMHLPQHGFWLQIQHGVTGVIEGKCTVSYNWLFIKWLQWLLTRRDTTGFAVQYGYISLGV